MRAQRIRTGFHRAGLLATALLLLPAVFVVAASFLRIRVSGYTEDVIIFCALAGLASYPVARAIGWTIVGFLESEKS